ncbi:MAG: hypothetical protein U5J98_08465 [Halobacteriales archaeon]|nr:hypothetical protein [Halobacteriales archaeon]
MVDLAATIQLAGYALGALGAGLLFIELFQLPSYLDYQPEFEDYTLRMSPDDPTEYTTAGRVGTLLLALAFALLFVAALL